MIYKFVVISGEDDRFLRDFEFAPDNTLLEFHEIIQEELEYDNSQIASFFTTNSNWEKEEEFTLFDFGADTTLMEEVTIEDVVIEKNQKLLYVFDQFNERAFFIEMVGNREPIEGREYPICTNSHGKPPPQVLLTDFSNNDFIIDPEFDNSLYPDYDPDKPEFENLDDYNDL